MFFKVLFLLTCYCFYKESKQFVKETAKDAELTTGECISFGLTVLFYVMVMTVCFLPNIVLW